MGELKFKSDLSIKDAASLHNKSEGYIRKYIRLGVIEVRHFNGKPIKPYQIVAEPLEKLFTVAALRSLKTREVAKILGRKPQSKEEFLWQK